MTCGFDCDVRIFDGDESTEFSVSSEKLSAITCYRSGNGEEMVALGMDDHSVQSFQLDVSTVYVIETCQATTVIVLIIEPA